MFFSPIVAYGLSLVWQVILGEKTVTAGRQGLGAQFLSPQFEFGRDQPDDHQPNEQQGDEISDELYKPFLYELPIDRLPKF